MVYLGTVLQIFHKALIDLLVTRGVWKSLAVLHPGRPQGRFPPAWA